METYTDYDYYKSEYKGQLDKSSFDKYAISATLEIKNKTQDRATSELEEVKLCMCKLVDVMNDNNDPETKDISSEKVDNYTKTLVVKTAIDRDIEYYNIISNFLGRFGLLFGGVPVVY